MKLLKIAMKIIYLATSLEIKKKTTYIRIISVRKIFAS